MRLTYRELTCVVQISWICFPDKLDCAHLFPSGSLHHQSISAAQVNICQYKTSTSNIVKPTFPIFFFTFYSA